MELRTLLVSALGVAIFPEGLPDFIASPTARRTLEHRARTSDGAPRRIGLGRMPAGVALTYPSH